jgi:DNA-binding CsgD family transcriptional regulator
MQKTYMNESRPVERKTFKAALKHFFKVNIPSLAGDMICEPVANEIVQLVDKYFPETTHMRPGQVLWFPVDASETSGYGKKIEDCSIKPVILNLITDEDIKNYVNKTPKRLRQRAVAVRLHKEAYKQGAVMTYADTAAIMRLSPNTVGKYIREYEKETKETVPRRGNIHDMGPTLTHKKMICIKHLIEGKSVEQTCRETNHSPEAVTRYTNDFRRVQVCLEEGWTIDKISQATGLTKPLIQQYVDIMEEQNKLNE